jgi:4-methyl-5(b-hydroxyethyl)-thiazole monophosphate biosynthesis
MKRALLILSEGFEEIEAVTPLDLLRRAGVDAVAASTGPGLVVAGARGVRVQADRMLDDCLAESFDMLILPGGPGVDNLRRDARVLDLVRRSHAAGVPIAAICAAPVILADAGVAGLHTLTSFPAREAELTPVAKAYVRDRVVVDGNLITSRGAGTAEEFSLALVAFLQGPAAAETVRTQIVAR